MPEGRTTKCLRDAGNEEVPKMRSRTGEKFDIMRVMTEGGITSAEIDCVYLLPNSS